MMEFLIAVQFFAVAAMLICMMQLVRLQFLSKALQGVIDETYENRMANLGSSRKEEYQYPNVDATYKNLKWYKPWERPSTLIVYDKEVI